VSCSCWYVYCVGIIWEENDQFGDIGRLGPPRVKSHRLQCTYYGGVSMLSTNRFCFPRQEASQKAAAMYVLYSTPRVIQCEVSRMLSCNPQLIGAFVLGIPHWISTSRVQGASSLSRARKFCSSFLQMAVNNK